MQADSRYTNNTHPIHLFLVENTWPERLPINLKLDIFLQ